MKNPEGKYPLRIKIRSELLPLVLLVILLVLSIYFVSSNIPRIILGLPFVLFMPGYILMAVLFPRRGVIGNIERVALSFGLSIAVVPIIGLILNFTSWGIRLESILWSLASFVFIMAALTWFRRRRLPEAERFGIEFTLSPVSLGNGVQNRVMSIILILTVLGALWTMGYAITSPKVGQQFTEFYVLGLEDKTTDYPKELSVGEEGKVITGIINHEYEAVSYRLEIRINGLKDNELGPIILEHEEKWEGEATFVPQVAGEKQRVEFLLYKHEGIEPYLEALHLWIDVRE